MDFTLPAFTKGVHNLLTNEQIPADSAQDALGFVTQDGRQRLVPGRKAIGAEGTLGKIRALGYGYRNDGTQVLYRKNETAIQYLNGSTWTDIVTGLTSGSEYTFCPYVSLAGTFMVCTGVDGIFKINNANPTSYVNLYDERINDKGKAIIDKGRMIMWDCANASKTTLKLSHIDGQDSSVYTTVDKESLGTGNGANKTSTGTLAFKATNPLANSFGIRIAAATGTLKTITAITVAAQGQITSVGHGMAVNDVIVVSGVLGMTQINNLILTVATVVDADNFKVSTSTLTFSAYSSGGTFGKAEVVTDNRNGLLTSPAGATGTINYTTGAYSVTFFTAPTNLAPVVTDYQWENSNSGGITDFTFSLPRTAGQGNRITQDIGGDPIVSVLVGQDGGYYSLKQQSAYRLLLSDDDLTFNNNVFYQNMGMPYFRAGASTQKGIVFINTSNPDKPEVTILVKNPQGGDAIIPNVLFSHFKFSDYDYSEASIDTYERYLTIACKSYGAANNNTVLLCNVSEQTVDITPYAARMFAKDNSANLYVGSPLTQTVYQIYNGYDDMDAPVDAYWVGKAENYAASNSPLAEELKKMRRLRVRGLIDPAQKVDVYMSYDDADFQLIGTIEGTGSYVDYQQSQAIGANYIGQVQIGGDDIVSAAYPYFREIKVHAPKFRKRTIKFIPTNIGYFDFSFTSDWDILRFENRIPKRFRVTPPGIPEPVPVPVTTEGNYIGTLLGITYVSDGIPITPEPLPVPGVYSGFLTGVTH